MTKSQNKGLITGLLISALSLVASAIVIPEVRVFLGLQEPHKVTSPDERNPKFELIAKKEPFVVSNIVRWRPNGRLGIPFSFPVKNIGGSTSRNSQVRISQASLAHEQKEWRPEGFGNEPIDIQLNNITPKESRFVSLTYWLDDKITSIPPGEYEFEITIFSGEDGSSSSTFNYRVKVNNDLQTIEEG